MIDLVITELRRLRWRRAVLLLVLAALVVPLLILAGTAWETRPFSDAEVAAAEQAVQLELQAPRLQKELARCERDPERFMGAGASADDCAAMVPSVDNYLWRQPLDVAQMPDNEGVAAITFLATMMFIVGTTIVGHDWNTGSMSNQMLFEPRRSRVWAAKALALLLVSVVVGVVSLVLFWSGTATLAASRDVAITDGTWGSIRGVSLRGVLLVVAASLAGYAVTMLFRSTVATLAVGFAVVAGGSLLLLALLGDSRATPLLLPTNALAFLQDGYHYYVWSGRCEATMGIGGDVVDTCGRTLSMRQGASYVFGGLAVALALSMVSFRRRDLP